MAAATRHQRLTPSGRLGGVEPALGQPYQMEPNERAPATERPIVDSCGPEAWVRCKPHPCSSQSCPPPLPPHPGAQQVGAGPNYYGILPWAPFSRFFLFLSLPAPNIDPSFLFFAPPPPTHPPFAATTNQTLPSRSDERGLLTADDAVSLALHVVSAWESPNLGGRILDEKGDCRGTSSHTPDFPRKLTLLPLCLSCPLSLLGIIVR